MRSMFSGVSGLRIHQTKMDVIANNISNVNTVGFKSSRVTFNEVFYQTTAGASGANAESGRGGVNPTQIGLGASVASIDKNMTQGAAQRTDIATDVMINGDGFFIVGDNSGTYFTRAGAMTIDDEGNLVTPTGMRVMGWDTAKDANGKWVVNQGNVKPITFSGDKQYAPPSPTTNIEFEGNLNPVTNPTRESSMDFYDTVGNRYVVNVKYTLNGADWDMTVGDVAYIDGDKTKPGVKVAVAGLALTLTGPPNVAPGTEVKYTALGTGKISFDTEGDITGALGNNNIATDPELKVPITVTGTGLVPNSTFGIGGTVTLKFGKLKQYVGESANAKAVKVDGAKPGTLSGLSIGTDGIITGRYSNGTTRPLNQIPVARFKNPAGLEKIGDNLYVSTSNSGDFDGVGEDVQGGGGRMMGGVLEMANVDLAAEFTDMITTQRGFQANSRIITTSDEMLNELVNIKR